MKKIIIMMILGFITLNANAETYSYLIFTMSDGITKVYSTEGLKITYGTNDSDEYVINVTSNGTTDTLLYSDVTNMYFSNELPETTTKSFDLVITSAQLATLYLDYAATIPSGVFMVAYGKSIEIEDNNINITKITGTVPANTGVIVFGNAGTYTFEETTESVESIEDNLFRGTTTDITVDEAIALAEEEGMSDPIICTLGYSNGYGFYKYSGNTLGANKAYLPYSASTATENESAINGFTLALEDVNGTTTFINKIAEEKSGDIYDLQGRKVNIPTKGIYIMNGQKMIVK